MTAATQLTRACAEVAADGTDPRQLARVLAAALHPRRSLDALRRRIRDGSSSAAAAGDRLADAAGPVSDASVAPVVAVVRHWSALGVQVAVVGDRWYPPRLAEGWPHTDGPAFVAWRGAPLDPRPTVALVGARRATGYGTAIAAWLADAAVTAGVRVVSGGAVGIDAAAHRAATARDAPTAVVLGCGHAVEYPRPHARSGGLFDEVLAAGGTLLSELLPDAAPHPGHVRARNRIVAGLADVVVVIEGGARSGALLTSSAAGERGRTVLAVPGDVRAPGSQAPHALLREGAGPCTGPEDLLDALGAAALPVAEGADTDQQTAVTAANPTGDRQRPAHDMAEPRHGVLHQASVQAPLPLERPTMSALPPEVRAVLAEAWPRPLPLERLATTAGRPVPGLLAALTRARMAGEIAESADGIRLRRAP